MTPLGIAITTFNRRDFVITLTSSIRLFSKNRLEIVICDDGSTDGTVEALRRLGEFVISGENRGVAWNKNRGLFFLRNCTTVENIVLLDDDIEIVKQSWDEDWVTAIRNYGHVNYVFDDGLDKMSGGSATPDDPGLAAELPGCAIGFRRDVLEKIGYFDSRFGRYGHEHVELTHRAIRAGYGKNDGQRLLGYVIQGGLRTMPTTGNGSPEDILANQIIWESIMNDPTYRPAWTNSMAASSFLYEIANAFDNQRILHGQPRADHFNTNT